ncbi:MAG: hypothetical protein ABSD61_13075 [Terracidiphilus sp.]|jgi:hypothetical protein
MKSPAKCAAWLLPLLLAGCFHTPVHKGQPAQPMLAPLIEPSVPLELAFVELPPTMRLIPGKPLYNMRVFDESAKPLIRHWRRANPTEIVSTSEAPTNPGPEVSAIGELSSGNPVSDRQQTEQSIANLERGLNGINRTLNDTDQKTADQVREFLKEARTALASGDVDGARTLVAKAQVLLAALTH